MLQSQCRQVLRMTRETDIHLNVICIFQDRRMCEAVIKIIDIGKKELGAEATALRDPRYHVFWLTHFIVH